jgi:hypothetical protein
MAGDRIGEIFDVRKTLVGDDAVGLLAKLHWEIEQLEARKGEEMLVRMFMSFNAASTAWHLHEWIWKLSNEAQRGLLLDAVDAETRDWQGFVLGLQRKSPAMAICRQLANAGKHMTLKHGREDIYAELIAEGDHDYPEGAVLLLVNGERHRDIDVYAAALKLWLKVYRDLGLKHADEIRAAAPWLDEEHN